MEPLAAPIPMLRITDEAAARAFYLDFLGFTVGFEWRHFPGAPLYLEVRRDACVIHLSQHVGDGPFGVGLRIAVPDVAALAQDLRARPGNRPVPDPKLMPWRSREIILYDPDDNRLCFYTDPPA